MTFHCYSGECFTILQLAELLLRIVVAAGCGMLLGLERTRRFKEAGIRTYLLVACCSALIMIVSKYGFADLAVSKFPGTKEADGARLAAQVVSGIGFLGAGMIFRNDNKVTGLTTAAGMWATAGIGLSIGAGLYLPGLFATGFILLLQVVLHKFTFRKDLLVLQTVTVTVSDPGDFRMEMLEFFHANQCKVFGNQIVRGKDGVFTFQFRMISRSGDHTEDLAALLDKKPNVITYNLQTSE